MASSSDAPRLYIGGLDYQTVESDVISLLRSALMEAGIADDVFQFTSHRDRESGMSCGFGFISVTGGEQAVRVILGLNGRELMGRTVTINEARPFDGNRIRGPRFQRNFGPAIVPDFSVVVPPAGLISTIPTFHDGDSENEREIGLIITTVDDALLRRLDTCPETFNDLSPRLFEEVVAEILSRLQYEVHLTPATRDGGKDMYALKKDHLGTFLFVVECKRYAPNKPVGNAAAHRLYGVVQAEKATAGIIATTSYFTNYPQRRAWTYRDYCPGQEV